jgi:hypothetical protein
MSAFHRFHEEVPNRWTLEFPDPSLDCASLDTFLDDFRALLAEEPKESKEDVEERLELVVDLSNLRVPPGFEYVQRLVSFLMETESLRARRCGAIVVVAPNAGLRAFVSTVCTIQPPCTPIEIVNCLPAPAVAAALKSPRNGAPLA